MCLRFKHALILFMLYTFARGILPGLPISDEQTVRGGRADAFVLGSQKSVDLALSYSSTWYKCTFCGTKLRRMDEFLYMGHCRPTISNTLALYQLCSL